MSSTHKNEVIFKLDDAEFSYEFSGNYSITSDETWKGVTSQIKTGEIIITAECGRKGSQTPADWFMQQIKSDRTKLIHALGGDSAPQNLNFAFDGVLTINNQSVHIVLGQGHLGSKNNWFVGSNAIVASDDNKSGTLIVGGVRYKVKTDGSYTFKLKKP